MKYVYLIRSINYPDQRYIGLTKDLKTRLAKHNEGGSPHTLKYKPWRLITFIRFEDDSKAVDFERYLKTGSGRAFANKHLTRRTIISMLSDTSFNASSTQEV